MMRSPLKVFACTTVALLLSACVSQAATIIKLDLGGTGPDVTYSGGAGGTFSTLNDGNAGTTGNQDTAILYTGFLSSTPATTGSYSLSGALAAGPPVVVGTDVTQNLAGGNFKLFNASNALLLDVNLGLSQIHGNLTSDLGAEFSITNGTAIGGSLASQLVATSIGTSMNLSNISGGALVVSGGFLNSFTADASKLITATQVPEPTAILLALGAIMLPVFFRRRG